MIVAAIQHLRMKRFETENVLGSELSLPKATQDGGFRKKTTVTLMQQNNGCSLKTNPNFDTNAPPFEARGCKVNLGGAYLSQGVQNTN